jgi:molybdopterin synthase sulfur carrier subunit
MLVSIRYFASIREALGPGEIVDVPAGSTVGAVRDCLIERSQNHARALSRSRALRAAVDMVMADESAPVREDAEVAFFPPVTGG